MEGKIQKINMDI